MIGRKREIEILNPAYMSPDAEFFGVYGRRRVGKTYLISQAFAGKFVLHHSGLSPLEEDEESDGDGCTESAMVRQLRHFHSSLLREGEKSTERKAARNAIFVQERLPKKATTHKVLLTTFGVAEGEYMWTFDNVVTLQDLMKN